MAVLTQHSYGKSAVRLTKVSRLKDRIQLKELIVEVMLQGDFARCYTHGDNSHIIPTDTMKNTVHALAKKHEIFTIEQFGKVVASHFIREFEYASAAEVVIREVPWQ